MDEKDFAIGGTDRSKNIFDKAVSAGWKSGVGDPIKRCLRGQYCPSHGRYLRGKQFHKSNPSTLQQYPIVGQILCLKLEESGGYPLSIVIAAM